MGKAARRMRRLGQSNKRTAEATADTASRPRLINALRSAAVVLKQYADESNWVVMMGGSPDTPEIRWIGKGNGPELAQKVLGIKKDEKVLPSDNPQGDSVQQNNPIEGKKA